MNFKVSAKRNNKWWTFGNIKINQFGNPSLSFKNTPELKEWMAQQGDWINFALFEDKGQPKDRPPNTGTPPIDDEIPFD